jgi:4-aminobutyrate aminotransferase-like enzyme
MTNILMSTGNPEAPTTMSSVLHRTIDHKPVIISRAAGNYLYTQDGHKILDGCGGAAVVSIGHCDERVVSALHEQVSGAGGTRLISDENGVLRAQRRFQQRSS